MADPDQSNSISGGEPAESPQPSLREIAEQAYDEGSTSTEAEAPSSDGRARDDRGRFAPREQGVKTGEAEDKAPPSPEQTPEAQTPQDDPAQQGNRSPDHWSAEDRAVYERLPPDAKAMLQRRYSEMEADYTRKSQANAAAVNAINSIAPVFGDPDIQRTLREQQVNPVQAIHDWASVYKRSVSPHVHERAALMIELAERMGFDPARLFAVNRAPEPNLPPEAQKDPGLRYLADKFGATVSEVQALRNEVQTIRQQEAEKYEQQALQQTRRSIDSYADEKGPDGRALRPDFDEQLPYILELFKADPDRDLAEAYDIARRMNPKTWESMVAAEKARVGSQQSLDRAKAANRGNLRGITAPVSKPNGKPSSGSLRDMLEASADEVGFS